MKNNFQIKNQFNTVYGLAIDMDFTTGSNIHNTRTYNIQGLYNIRTQKAKNLSIVAIDSHRYEKSERLELSKWCKKNDYDYKEIERYIIKNILT